MTARLAVILAMASLLPLVLTRLGLPVFIRWQAGKKFLILNYEGKKIATAGGTIIFLSLLLCYPFFIFLPFSFVFPWKIFFFYIFGITFLGVIDDFWGEKECKGLKGHLGKFLRGEGISTGMCKAVGGLFLGIIVSSIIGGHWPDRLMGGLYLALLSNLFNLLDTRPGRAIKIFSLTSLPLAFYHGLVWLLIPIWGILNVYLPYEENKEIMLGDTGAYMLGGILGFSSLFVLSARAVIFLNIFMLLVHLFCERFSLSGIMDKMLWLGRKSQ